MEEISTLGWLENHWHRYKGWRSMDSVHKECMHAVLPQAGQRKVVPSNFQVSHDHLITHPYLNLINHSATLHSTRSEMAKTRVRHDHGLHLSRAKDAYLGRASNLCRFMSPAFFKNLRQRSECGEVEKYILKGKRASSSLNLRTSAPATWDQTPPLTVW